MWKQAYVIDGWIPCWLIALHGTDPSRRNPRPEWPYILAKTSIHSQLQSDASLEFEALRSSYKSLPKACDLTLNSSIHLPSTQGLSQLAESDSSKRTRVRSQYRIAPSRSSWNIAKITFVSIRDSKGAPW